MKDSPLFEQAKLVLRVLPLLNRELDFALKGGTAINFFFQQVPRVSVDIDLCYLPIENRETSLIRIHSAMERIAENIRTSLAGSYVKPSVTREANQIRRLSIRFRSSQIKIEPNLVIRGSVFPPEKRILTQKAQELFGLFVSANTLSHADTYAGKICAALDRQHPRDLFDIRMLLDDEGLTESIRKALVVYLASSNRPMSELLDPTIQDNRETYERELLGMTDIRISYSELREALEELVYLLMKSFTPEERDFLVSFKLGKPDWKLLGLSGIEELPALKWKLLNIQRMEKSKRETSLEKLKNVLEI